MLQSTVHMVQVQVGQVRTKINPNSSGIFYNRLSVAWCAKKHTAECALQNTPVYCRTGTHTIIGAQYTHLYIIGRILTEKKLHVSLGIVLKSTLLQPVFS